MIRNENLDKEIKFIKLAEKLKTEMRHSWLSDGRRESVAEHSWRLSLMALRYAEKLDQPVDLLKCLKIAIIHDLVEVISGDIPIFNVQTIETKRQRKKLSIKLC